MVWEVHRCRTFQLITRTAGDGQVLSTVSCGRDINENNTLGMGQDTVFPSVRMANYTKYLQRGQRLSWSISWFHDREQVASVEGDYGLAMPGFLRAVTRAKCLRP